MMVRCLALGLGLALFLGHIFWMPKANAANPIPAFVSIVPQKYFVEKIGGNHVDVSIMVFPGASPATYEPKPNQLVALSKAKIYFAIGVPFESVWLKKIAETNRKMLIVPTEKGIEKRVMEAHVQSAENDLEPHRVRKEEQVLGHNRGIRDPHVWTSPPLVMILARNILMGLLSADPSRRAIYEANYKRFIMEVVDLDAEIRSIFAGKGGDIRFMVFHPAWGYFADAYGLKQVPIEVEGKEPKPAQMQRTIEYAKKEGIKVIFVQPQFSTKSADVIAKAIGGKVLFADPLARDWARDLREQATKFGAALR